MADRMHVGYVLKQYPRLSETFVLSEILGLEREEGIDVSIFSLRPATEGRFHPQLSEVRGPVHYMPLPDKGAFLDALRTLAELRTDALPRVMEVLDLVPADRRARLAVDALTIAHRVIADDITHLHAHFLTGAAHTAHLVHLLTGVPYTVTAHAKDIYRHTVDWALAGRIAGAAVAAVTVCDANLRHLQRQLDGSGTHLVRVYNGLGPQDPPAPLEARTQGLVLGVGRLVEKKGFDLLLEAVAALAPTRPGLRCVIVGDGDQRAALEALTDALAIADRVTFTGALPQPDVARWLREAHVLAAPCRVGGDGNQDALPTVLLEALGAGLPSVSTPVAGIPEIVGHDREGLLVEEGSASALAEGIATLLDDSVRWTSMATAGPPKLAQRFDRRQTVAQLVETMRSAVMA